MALANTQSWSEHRRVAPKFSYKNATSERIWRPSCVFLAYCDVLYMYLLNYDDYDVDVTQQISHSNYDVYFHP